MVATVAVARVTRTTVGIISYFSDRKYGGKGPALRAANRYAERIADKLRVTRSGRRYLLRGKSRGVYRFVNLKKPNKPAMWIATASPEVGKPKHRQFCVTKYGEEKARLLAIRARAEMVKQILGR